MVAVLLGGGFQRERIGSSGRFRQCKTATILLAQLRQVFALLFRRTELDHERVDQRVVDVDEGGRCRAYLGQFLHHQHGGHEVTRTATILVAHLNTHQPIVEQGTHNRRIELVLLVHLLHQRCNLFLCQLGYRFLHHQFILTQIGKRGCGTVGRSERGAGERAGTDRTHRSDHLAENVLQHLAAGEVGHWYFLLRGIHATELGANQPATYEHTNQLTRPGRSINRTRGLRRFAKIKKRSTKNKTGYQPAITTRHSNDSSVGGTRSFTY
uniref:Uncharacterized protein n=1 Tax=Anopheles culicifacies TaxID=139723 RepID=A0A182M3K4_9DIPT